jgi:hypothetical protein
MRAEAVRGAFMVRLVTMIVSVQEHLDSRVGPSAEPGRELGAGNYRGGTPVVRDHQHRHAIADALAQFVHEPIDLAFEAWRHVMN